MQVRVHASIERCEVPFGTTCVTPGEKGITFHPPPAFVEAGFPVTSDSIFPCPSILSPEAISSSYVAACIDGLTRSKTNHVVFGYGQCYSLKRDQLFGPNGFAAALLSAVCSAAVEPNVSYAVMCYGLGEGDELVDFLDPSNQDGIIVDHAQEGPRATKLVRRRLKAGEADRVAAAITANVAAHFARVRVPPTKPEEQALPPYLGTTVVMVLHRYATEADFASMTDENSIHVIALGDTNRPVLCGVDPAQQLDWENAQRVSAAVCGVIIAVNCNRLRIPFGKSRLTTMLKRSCNAEKSSGTKAPNGNNPTVLVVWFHLLDDEGNAEEAYHTLCTLRRCVNLVGGAAVGTLTRDLAADKWRVEQDILELKDELAIAKAVHDYKPCIYDQPKPVANVAEEVKRRIEAIRKKRTDARLKAEQELEKRALEEAQKYIAKLEEESGKTMAGLERQLRELQDEKLRVEAERNKKREEHERHLAKIQKKKDEEEAAAAKLRSDVEAIEAELKAKRELVAKKRVLLEAVSEDQSKARESILREREEIRQTRAKLVEKRREERVKWLNEIQQTNDRLLAQLETMNKARSDAAVAGVSVEDSSEQDIGALIRADIASINEYLPKLIALDNAPADADATEAIRRQLEEYFETELRDYTAKLEAEKKKLAVLQGHVDTYRAKLEDHHSKQKKEMLNEALKKDNHLQSLVDQVVQYLQHGHCMYKISSTGSVRYRFFFLSEDCKKMCACELDENGMAVNRRKPTTTVLLKDVVRVVLGMYTPSFVNFAGSAAALRAQRDAAMRDEGYSLVALTTTPDAKTLGRYNYRAFALELSNSKTVELVCETDSDCEAWIVALKRLFNYRTDYERRTSRSVKEPSAEIRWGGPLDVRNRPGASRLNAAELAFCEEYHVPPMLFLNTKDIITSKSQNSYVTVYDVRVSSKMDLLRAQQLYEFFIDNRVIPPPRA